MAAEQKEADNARAPSSFEVIPAVDLLGDDVVRLERGDFSRVVARERDPADVVGRFVAAGARLLHVVDLEGARSGRTRPELVRELMAKLTEIKNAGRSRP